MEHAVAVALALVPHVDFAATTTVSAANATEFSAERWAREIFTIPALPAWVKGLFAVLGLAARVLRLPPGDPAMPAVSG